MSFCNKSPWKHAQTCSFLLQIWLSRNDLLLQKDINILMVVLQAPTDYSFYQNENNIDFVYNQNGSRVSTLALVLLYDFIFKRQRTIIFPWSKKFYTITEITQNQGSLPKSRRFSTIKEVFHNKGNVFCYHWRVKTSVQVKTQNLNKVWEST